MGGTTRGRKTAARACLSENRVWSVSWVENRQRRYSHRYPSKDLAETVVANLRSPSPRDALGSAHQGLQSPRASGGGGDAFEA